MAAMPRGPISRMAQGYSQVQLGRPANKQQELLNHCSGRRRWRRLGGRACVGGGAARPASRGALLGQLRCFPIVPAALVCQAEHAAAMAREPDGQGARAQHAAEALQAVQRVQATLCGALAAGGCAEVIPTHLSTRLTTCDDRSAGGAPAV